MFVNALDNQIPSRRTLGEICFYFLFLNYYVKGHTFNEKKGFVNKSISCVMEGRTRGVRRVGIYVEMNGSGK